VPPDFGEREYHISRVLIEYALLEDLQDVGDLTCRALIDPAQPAVVNVVAREAGVLAGWAVAALVFEKLSDATEWEAVLDDGAELQPGCVLARVHGPLAAVLTGERTALNFLTHLSGVASLTRRFVNAVAGTKAGVFDTRKTIPGFRALEKYAVRCGGGRNHRMGLYDGVLIKDNHLAALAAADRNATIADAVRRAREFLGPDAGVPIEVEVDTLDQLRDALQGGPDQILLDNMPPETLREAVRLRDELAPQVELEASGGITLDSIRAVAETGVERISIGALTHSAPYLDIGFDWPV
jgi:nicotinate-nucleotide pyrophosphorylase (carboxylating)